MDLNELHDVIMVDLNDALFAVNLTIPIFRCGQKGLTTNLPKLLVIKPSESGQFYFEKKPLQIENLDMMVYINSKFIFLDRYVGDQMTYLYTELERRQCEQSRELLKNLQAIAMTNEIEFGYHYAGPGYFSIK